MKINSQNIGKDKFTWHHRNIVSTYDYSVWTKL